MRLTMPSCWTPIWVVLSMADPLLNIESVTAGYRPDLPILHDVSAYVGNGEIVTLIGPNGAGKSTLIKAIANLVHVQHGNIKLAGESILNKRTDQMCALGMAYVPQLENIFRTLTVQQNLVLAAQRIKGNKIKPITDMQQLFPQLAEFSTRKAGGLSGGQRQMLAIAMALLAKPRLILMDEPTAGLSPKIAQEVLTLIKQTAASGVSILLVEQNARAALAITDRAYVLAEGRNQHEGSGIALLNDPLVGKIYLGAWRKASA